MINLYTSIDMNSGIGITGYNIAKELYNLDDKITLFPINGVASVEETWDRGFLQKSFQNQRSFDQNFPCLKIWHSYEMFNRIVGNSPYYGFVFFKLDKFRPEEIHGLSLLDKIFVSSNWAKNILLQNNINKEIIVCPHGIDTSIFNAEIPEDKTEDKYIFINIGKWEVRKGHDVLIGMFNHAFPDNDNIELWMLNYNVFLDSEQNQKWADYYQTDKIKIFPRLPTQKALSKVIAYADCGLFPSRSESWNSSLLEVMAMNKPVITTNYSAHTEYCDNDNAYLINIDNLELADDGLFFNNYGYWADLGEKQIEQIIEHMRYVYKNNIRTNPAGVETVKKYTWGKMAKILYENIVQ